MMEVDFECIMCHGTGTVDGVEPCILCGGRKFVVLTFPNREPRVSFRFLWYDFWVGAFYDRDKRVLYICPLPCCVLKVRLSNGG